MAPFSLIFHHSRHAVRLLRRNPGTSGLAILALAAGISLTVTTFSVVDGLLLSTLPFEHGERYVFASSLDAKRSIPPFRMDLHDYADLRRGSTSFDAFVPFLYRPVNLSDEIDFPERREAAFAPHEFFSAMPFAPQLGRGFLPEEDVPGAAAVAVIGHNLWQQRFGARLDVLDREIQVDGERTRIIGVMPPGFRFPVRQEIWLPLRLDPDRHERGQAPVVHVVGRLRPEVSLAEARTELATLAERLARDFPQTHAGRTVVLTPYTEHFMWPWLRSSLWVLMMMVALGLLIACANVATLLLARAVGRMRDLAISTALGASRGTIIGYVLGESLLLAVLGAFAGLLLAALGVAAVARQMSWIPLPFWMEITLDGRILTFAVIVTVLTGVVAGTYPAWHASRTDAASWLHGGRAATPRILRFVRSLVIGKVAFAYLLLVCTGLFLRSTKNFDQLDLGVDSEKVLTAHLELPLINYPNPQDRIDFLDELVASIRSASAVVQAAAATSLPVMGFAPQVAYELEGEPREDNTTASAAHRIAITPEFLTLFDLPVFQGRPLLASDRQDTQRVVVVNRSFAARAWPGEQAVGQRLRWKARRGEELAEPTWWQVVGVVADLWPGTLADGKAAAIYLPQAQAGETSLAIMAVTQSQAETLTDLLRKKVHGLDPALPLYDVRTLHRGIESEMFHTRMFARATTALGLVALLLAAVGIYGVNVFQVRQRIPEFGVRMALGASRREIVGLILGQGLWRMGWGLALGVVLAALVTPLMSWLFFGVDARNPTTFLLTALFLAAITLLACLGPALRASKISPIRALHHE